MFEISVFALAQLLVDFGLFILVWIVQLVVYPGFTFFPEKEIKAWHPKYARNISFVVFPLMTAQLGIALFDVLQNFSLVRLGIAFFVIMTWAITFFLAVPLHRQVEIAGDSRHARLRLVQVNWSRTILWTLIFLTDLIRFVFQGALLA